jgi:hypothetical protein
MACNACLFRLKAVGDILCYFSSSKTQRVLPELQTTHVRKSAVMLACIGCKCSDAQVLSLCWSNLHELLQLLAQASNCSDELVRVKCSSITSCRVCGLLLHSAYTSDSTYVLLHACCSSRLHEQ